MKGFKTSLSMCIATAWGVWIFVAIGALGWALFTVLEAFGVMKDAPAWVQAVGSVGAILIAVWVANRESNERRSTERDRENELLKKIYGVAKYATEVSVNTYSYIDQDRPEDDVVAKLLGSLRECELLLKEVSFIQVPLSEVALGWLELRHAVNDVRDHTERYLDDPTYDNRDRYYMELAKNRAVMALRRMAAGAGVALPEILPTI
jgi:hypothetical protein